MGHVQLCDQPKPVYCGQKLLVSPMSITSQFLFNVFKNFRNGVISTDLWKQIEQLSEEGYLTTVAIATLVHFMFTRHDPVTPVARIHRPCRQVQVERRLK